MFELHFMFRGQTCWHQEFNGFKKVASKHLIYQAPVLWYVHQILLFMHNMSIIYDDFPHFRVHRRIPYGLQLFGHFVLRSQRMKCIQFHEVDIPKNYSFEWGVGNNPFGAFDTFGFDSPSPLIAAPAAVYTRANAFRQSLQESGQCGEVVDEDALLLLANHEQHDALKKAIQRNAKVSKSRRKESSKKEFAALHKESDFKGVRALEADMFFQQYKEILDTIFCQSLSTYQVYSKGDSKLLKDVKEPLENINSLTLKPTKKYNDLQLLQNGVPMNFPKIGGKNDPVPSDEEVELSLTYGYHVKDDFVKILLGLIHDEHVDRYEPYVKTFCQSIKICSGFKLLNKTFYTARMGKRKYII